jgi:hypothetical protein
MALDKKSVGAELYNTAITKNTMPLGKKVRF